MQMKTPGLTPPHKFTFSEKPGFWPSLMQSKNITIVNVNLISCITKNRNFKLRIFFQTYNYST